MIPIWPTDLPQRVLRDGYSEGMPDGRLRSAMEGGPPKVRRRFSSAARPVQAAIKVTTSGKGRLENFWLEETLGGSLPFHFPRPGIDGEFILTDGVVPLLGPDGLPIRSAAWWLVLFGEQPPVFTPVQGVYWRAAFTLSVLP